MMSTTRIDPTRWGAVTAVVTLAAAVAMPIPAHAASPSAPIAPNTSCGVSAGDWVDGGLLGMGASATYSGNAQWSGPGRPVAGSVEVGTDVWGAREFTLTIEDYHGQAVSVSGPWHVDTTRDPGTPLLALTGDDFEGSLSPDCRGSSSAVDSLEIIAKYHGQDLAGPRWKRA